MKKKPDNKETSITRSSAAEYLTFITAKGDWEIPELRQFKALPEDGKAVHSKHWHSIDEAFANIASGLRLMLEKRKKKAEPIQAPACLRSEEQVTCGAKFANPDLPFAKELLDLILV